MCWFLAAVFLAAEQFFSGVCTVVSRVAAVDRAVVLAHPPRLTAARGQGGHQCYTVPRLPPPPSVNLLRWSTRERACQLVQQTGSAAQGRPRLVEGVRAGLVR